MAATRLPWYKRNPTKYLMATRDLTCEERGAYNDILELLYERDRRVADDSRFLAGFMGLSVRRWNQIRQSLLDAGKLKELNGYLTNDEFEAQRLQSEDKHKERQTWGHKGGKARAEKAKRQKREELERRQGSLSLSGGIGENPPFGPKTTLKATLPDGSTGHRDIKTNLSRFLPEFISEKSDSKLSTNGGNPPPDLKLARGRESRVRKEDIYSPTTESLTLRATGLAGVSTLKPATLERETAIVQRWVDAGLDFEESVFPTIEREVERTSERINSLAFFDGLVRKAKGRKRKSEPSSYPAGTDDDDPTVHAVREKLRRSVDPKEFEAWLRPLSLKLNGSGLKVVAPSQFAADYVTSTYRRQLESAFGSSEVRVVTA